MKKSIRAHRRRLRGLLHSSLPCLPSRIFRPTSRAPPIAGWFYKKYPDLEINHIHHAGNSSGIVDGLAAILLASPSYAKKHELKPRAKVVAMRIWAIRQH